MKILNALLFLLITCTGMAQTWNELPTTPPAPSAGQVGPNSNDFLIADDGRMYAVYLYDNGSGLQLYVKEWDGANWNINYQDFAYSGFESIHSYKVGSDIYFSCKIDNASLNDMMRIYKISNGSTSIVASINLNSIPDMDDYKFAVSSAQDFGYILHNDVTNTYILLTQIDLAGNTDLTVQIPNFGQTQYNYDMALAGDTVYVATTQGSPSATHLFKIPSDLAGVYPYNSTVTDGALSGSTSPAPQQLMMGYKFPTNSIEVFTHGSVPNIHYSYSILTGNVLQTPPTPNYAADQATPTAAVSEPDTIYFFNNFTNGSGSSPETEVLKLDLNTNVLSPVGTFPYLTLGADAVNHSMNYSAQNKRLAVEFYDIDQNQIRYLVSNTVPSINTTLMTSHACPNHNGTIVSLLGLADDNFDNLTILNIQSNDQIAAPDAGLNSTYLYSDAGVDYFNISAATGATGTFVLTLEVTDGYDTVSFTLNPITMETVTLPSFNVGAIHLCSGNGMVDLSGYVNPQGGTFNIGGATGMFSGTFINSDNSQLTPETATFINYTVMDNGCPATETANIVLHNSAVVSITTNPTTCGGATGDATATIAGGTAPFTIQSWSNGENSVTSVSGLEQGTYTFTLEDANSCMVITEFTIVPAGVDIVPTITNTTCNGDNDGQISINLTGFTAPTSILWSSGHSSLNPTNLAAGTYSVTVQDAANCIYSETFTLTQPNPLSVSTNSTAPNCGVSDGSVQVSSISGGIAPYDIAWSTGDVTPGVNNLPAAIYSVTVTDFNGCQTIQTIYLSDNNSANLSGVVVGADCGSSNGSIDVTPALMSGGQIQSIQWSNGPTTEDMLNVPPALYVCTLTTMNNCKAFKGWNIPVVEPLQQPICVITVDSTTSTNLVVWEEVQPTGISYYNIYRETSNQGEYILIDTVEATNISLFNDVVASPINRSWSYKISAVNACGTEGPLSLQHRTMHLSALANGLQTDVSWNAYEGTAYSAFDLWRYTFADGWVMITTLPTTQITYTDNIDPTTPGLDYMVELSLDEECSALVFRAQDFNTTRSNKDKGAFSAGEGTGDSNNDLNEWLLNQVTVFPNPTTDLLTIEQSTSSELFITLTDISGKQLKTAVQSSMSSTLNLGDLKPGTYIIELTIDNTKRVERIVKL